MRADANGNEERITARVPPNVKDLLEQATELSGARSLNQFILNAALKEANAVIEREKVIRLNEVASRSFFALLDNPPAPNKKLKAAVKKYKKTELHAHRASEQKA